MSGGRLIIGLMSGTSHDATDAALVRFPGSGRPELVHFTSVPHPPALRRAIGAAMGLSLAADGLCTLNFTLARAFARAALKCADGAGVKLSKISAIASHGQTIHHIPPKGRRMGSTLQLGDPGVIARMTGLRVVSGFRTADMAAGGQGAPLVPFADHVQFGHLAPVAVHNLGGISNVTLVTKKLDGITAFDTGPANSMLDAAARKYLGRPRDTGGRSARGGNVNAALLGKLMSHPYLRQSPPKSTGPEEFGAALLDGLLRGKRVSAPDVLRTLTEFTALSIAVAYRRFVLPKADIREVLFSGGGTKNTFLMSRIRQELSPLRVKLTDNYGVASSAREAMCFAILANETLHGRPSNVPSATGAKKRVVLGSITNP